MKKLAVGLIVTADSAGVYAQGGEVAGTTNAALITAGAVAAGSKTETT